MDSKRQNIIKQYMTLSDNTRESEYLFEHNRNETNRQRYESDIQIQTDYMSNHNITRSEIDQYMKRGVVRCSNVQQAMDAMFNQTRD